MMNYFIGRGIDSRLTGIEQAQVNRLRLFQTYDEPVKIVRFSYSRGAHADAARFGLTEDDICNLFDYYQHAAHVPTRRVLAGDFVKPGQTAVAAGTQGDLAAANIIKNRRIVAQVRYLQESQQVQQVLYVDHAGHIDHTDSYDSRGFCSRRSWMTAAGKHYADDYLTLDGQIAIHVDFNGDEQHGLRQIVMADHTVYHHFNELSNAFLQALDAQAPSRFYFDREYDHDMVTHLPLKGPRFLVVHNDHRAYSDAFAAQEKRLYDRLKMPYKPVDRGQAYVHEFEDPGALSGIIVSTTRQRQAIQADYPELSVPLAVAPVGVANPMPEKVPWTQRDPNLLLAVSRISVEKGLLDLIAAFIAAHQKRPQLHLEVYGAASGQAGEALLQQLHIDLMKAGCDDAVTFMGFRSKLAQVYDRAGLFVMTSSTEGFSIALQEALTYGVPAVAYDVDYGPRDMITPGINGELVPAGDVTNFASAVERLTATPSRMQALSNGAYHKREMFSATNVWAEYRSLMAEK